MRYNTAMAQKYFTNELVQVHPTLKSLGLALQGAPFPTDHIDLALLFTQDLLKSGRNAVLEAFKNDLQKPLYSNKSVTFLDLIKMLAYTKYLVHDSYHLERVLFGSEIYGEDAARSVFGLAKEARNLNEYIEDAILLLSLLQDAKEAKFREISTEAPKKQEDAPAPQTPQQEDVVSSGIVPPLGGGGSSSSKKKEEKEEKKKKEEEEEKKEKSEVKLDESALKSLAQSDRQFRHEILRIQSAITRQLASVYGIQDSQYAAFEQELARHISPIVYTNLQKLSGEDLSSALQHSSKQRFDLYLTSLSSLQRNPYFQQALLSSTRNAYKKQTGKELSPDEIKQLGSKITLGDTAKGVLQKFDQELTKEAKEKVAIQGAGSPLSPEQIAQIVSQHNLGANTVEQSLREIFQAYEKQGTIPITTSELNAFFIRLQSYGLSKRYASALSETDLEKFYNAFSQSFGKDSSRIMRAIQMAAGIDGNTERALFANLLLGYSDRVALDAYHNSAVGGGEKNLAALYAMPEKLPPNLQHEHDRNLEKELQSLKDQHLKREAVGLARYTPMAQLQAQLRSLKGTPKETILQNAINFQALTKERGGRRLLNMREKTVYYILSSVFGFQNIQQSIHFGDYKTLSIFQEAPSYLFALAPDQLMQDYYDPLSQPSSAEVEAQKYADQEKGLFFAKVAGFVFLGPESIEVLDKAWQIATTVRSVVKQLPGGEYLAGLLDFIVFDKFEQMGKFVDFMLKALAMAALAMGALFGTALAILPMLMRAANLSALAQNGLVAASQGIQAGAKSIFSGIQSGATKLNQGLQGILHNLQSAVGLPTSPTTIIYATGGIVGTAFLLQTVLFSAFLTPRTGGANSGILDGIRRSQPPDIGCLKLITQQSDVLEISRQTGEAGEPFPEDQIDQIKIAAGQVFASPTYKNNFCKGGTVNILYTPNKDGAAEVYGASTIAIRMGSGGGKSKWTQGIVTYSLVHEMEHILDNRLNFSQRMGAAVPITSCLPTYRLPDYCSSHLLSEVFAEAVAIYISPGCYPGAGKEDVSMPKACATYDLQRDFPLLYQWIKQNVFNGEL